ncbi:MAG: Na/Pi cotransporter family protein [Flavobacteriales bacterium]|nr:Na/Pi cotransporter family protein [Flavobacteriales bacterium]MCB9198308.1 Na/Pi cotransporter family protein [Flavobacteriales bacterium]
MDIFYTVLTVIGSLGFFIFGMKIMSEGIQKLAGEQLRTILSAATSNRFAGVLTGFVTTSIIQSSSATTVMVVSFVNAKLLSLRQAIGVIMGANIGTTMTAFLIMFFSFGKFSISDYSYPIMAFGVPMLFLTNIRIQSLGEFLIGFAVLFLGLDALKHSMSFLQENPDIIFSVVKPVSELNSFVALLLFIMIGTLLTIIVQSSSAAMAITITLCGSNGLPLEYGAAIILGENIGTTITANLAAMIGNVHAKRAARAHFFFNVIGVFWMLFVFYSFVDMSKYMVENSFFNSVLDPNDLETSKIRWSLAVFHLTFNIINTFLLVWFVNYLEKMVIKMVRVKNSVDEEYHLEFIGGGVMSTAELSIMQAQQELTRFGDITARMNVYTKKLLDATDKKDRKKFSKKIEKYEDITDKVEVEIIEYLGRVSQLPMGKDASRKLGAILAVASDLESIGDVYYQLSRVLDKKAAEKIWFSPEQRARLHDLIQKVDEAFVLMNANIKGMAKGKYDVKSAYALEKEINRMRNEIREGHLTSLDREDYNINSTVSYSNLYSGLEKIGDHILNVTETLNGNQEVILDN